MYHFNFLNSLDNLQLDIVGIVAVLGEGCTARIINASSLSWHHVLPRLLPAPQALLRHERHSTLPTQEGVVIGVYSGNYSPRLNFFCQLLHPTPIAENTVELWQVEQRVDVKQDDETNAGGNRKQVFGVPAFNILTLLSALGTVSWLVLLGLASHYHDGFALVATMSLGCTSSIVGLASWWRLKFTEVSPRADRSEAIPDSDVVIYYPSGAFRVVRCSEKIARLYFKSDQCEPTLGDDAYRFLALVASVSLMVGLLCMGNAVPEMKLSFAIAYILLNVVYWAASALNPMTWHWKHKYKVKLLEFERPGQGDGKVQPTSKEPGEARLVARVQPALEIAHRVRFAESSAPPRQKQSSDSIELQEPTQAPPEAEPKRVTTTQLEASMEDYGQQRLTLLRRATRASQRFMRFIKDKMNLRKRPKDDRLFTEALWTVIALTGSSRWLENRHIAPETDAWREWLRTAHKRARPKYQNKDDAGIVPAWFRLNKGDRVRLPVWNYNGELKFLLGKQNKIEKTSPPLPLPLADWADLLIMSRRITPKVRGKLKAWVKDAQERLSKGQRAEPIAQK